MKYIETNQANMGKVKCDGHLYKIMSYFYFYHVCSLGACQSERLELSSSYQTK